MAFLNEIESNTPERYRFRLMSANNEIVCNPEPLEWKSGTLNIKRDLDVGGVFSSFQQDSLTFVGNGAAYLRGLYELKEVNAQCTLIIEWWKNSIREYVEFPSRFDINFNFYEIVKIGKFAFGVRIKAINNSVQTKLDNRKDINVDITKLKSIGDFQITDYPALRKSILYDATNIYYSAHLVKESAGLDENELIHQDGVVTYTTLPLEIINNNRFTEIQRTEYATRITSLLDVVSFFPKAKYDYDFVIDYTFAEYVTNKYTGSLPWNLQLLETKIHSDGTIEIINTYDLGGFGGEEQVYVIEGSVTISVSSGNDLKLVVRSAGIASHYTAYSLTQRITITSSVAASPDSTSEGFPIYEAMERVCQHILDRQYPFYSEYFGRLDIQCEPNTANYLTENQLRFAHIQTGLNIRGILLSNTDAQLAVSFKDLFESMKSIWNVGYMLDSSIDGELRIRIEDYAYFFQDVQILDLSNRINKYDIESQVMPELIPSNIKCGFDNYEYLTVNGRGEPNTTSEYTSLMNTATKFENISKYRGDTKGIIDNLASTLLVDETVDLKSDSSVFVIKSQKYGEFWKPEKGENITINDDTSLFRYDLMNRYFTPSRMLIRQGNRVTCGMTKEMASTLTFQKSDKACNLSTTGLGLSIIENQNIDLATLESPIYKAMKHTITCRFDFSDLEILQSNSLGYIKFSDAISGYLLSLKKKNNEDKAEITIIERYTTSYLLDGFDSMAITDSDGSLIII